MRAGRVRDIGVRTSMLQSVFMNSLTLMSALALALVYGLGGVLAIGGHLQAGAIVSLALLLTRLYSPLTALANAHVEIASALVTFERVFEVLDLVPLIREKPDAVGRARTGAGVGRVRRRAVLLPVGRQGVAGLARGGRGAGRRGGDEVLHGISFTAQPGQMVALVGSSGAGKSTIASLLARLYDVDSGAVRLNGVDVRDVTFASLKDTVGMVTQDGHLFHESIGSNLRLAAPGRHRRRAVGRAANAPGWPTSSPRCPTGWTRSWGSAATGCPAANGSGSPSPACCWARRGWWCSTRPPRRWTRRRRPPCSRRSAEALAGRTSIVIAHRLSTVRAADMILVVEDGRIVERGTHESCWPAAAGTPSCTKRSSAARSRVAA